MAVRPQRVRRSSPRPRARRAQATTPASAWRRRVEVASTSRSSAERVVVRMRPPSRNLHRRGNRSTAGISHHTSGSIASSAGPRCRARYRRASRSPHGGVIDTSLRTIGRRQPDVSVPTNHSAPTRTARCDQGAGVPLRPPQEVKNPRFKAQSNVLATRPLRCDPSTSGRSWCR